MSNAVMLSTLIDAGVKKAVTSYCKRHGLKLAYVVEQALLERLEDEIDIEAYEQRKKEPTIPLEKVLKGIKKSARR